MSGKDVVERITEKDNISHWHRKALERKEDGVYRKVKDMLPEGLHLDVGCGEGFLLEEMDTSIGIDIIDEYLEKAKDYKKPLIKADILKLPFRDSIFGSLSFLFVLYNLYDRKGNDINVRTKKIDALKEAQRTMKDKGALVILRDIDNMLPYDNYLEETGFRVQKKGYIRKNLLYGYHKLITGSKLS